MRFFKLYLVILLVSVSITQINVGAETIRFFDVNGHWASSDIETMSEKGYIGGYEDGSFKPNGKITRAEFVSILTRILEIQGQENPFRDVSSAKWASEAIGGAYQMGIIDEREYRTQFKPNQSITRREMAKMIALAFAQAPEYKELLNTYRGLYYMDLPFADAENVTQSDIPYIALTSGLGIVGGDTNYKLNPSSYATRAEATAMLHRLVNKKGQPVNTFRALKEYEEVAKTGTNMTTVSKLIPKQDSYKDLVIENQNFKATLKRVYILPTNRSSLYEKKFALYRDSMDNVFKTSDIQGITVGIMDIEYKKDDTKGYFLYGMDLYFGSNSTIDYELYEAENVFGYITYHSDQGYTKRERKSLEVVDFDLYSLGDRFGEFQTTGVSELLLYVNPDAEF